jgi:hypothetical protein
VEIGRTISIAVTPDVTGVVRCDGLRTSDLGAPAARRTRHPHHRVQHHVVQRWLCRRRRYDADLHLGEADDRRHKASNRRERLRRAFRLVGDPVWHHRHSGACAELGCGRWKSPRSALQPHPPDGLCGWLDLPVICDLRCQVVINDSVALVGWMDTVFPD